MSSLFGGSKSTQSSTSSNQAYPQLSTAFSPVLDYTQQGGQGIQKLLSGDTSGLDAYKKGMGYDWAQQQGATGVVANQASKGLRDSGSTLKALSKYQSGLDNQYASDYLSQLFNFSNLGLQAGNTISGAGNVTKSTGNSSSNEGIGKTIGSIASLVAMSDRRLKKDIKKLSELSDGLGVYEWRYLWETEDDVVNVGHMADEIEKLRPWALGPEIAGYKTVDYGALNNGAS